ncbi:hypothetical protein P2H44_19155 [Albimonas sp. CAU 1670]|uniref:hypothetical protein n=1 Tax=Albimonas sp. CAU 1670 TaxID=3032599 RepID=UPI0023DC1D9B|nr:hypothetical protein [Albimonas sp. CAU 1670]MDF2234683.1 hypothetical protein [Albimonas sp. CAU 1670]
MSDKTDPDQTPGKGTKTPEGAPDAAPEAEAAGPAAADPIDAQPRPDEIEDAQPADEAPTPETRPADAEAMTAEEYELAAAQPGVDPVTLAGPEPDRDPETAPGSDAAEAGLDPVAGEELREGATAEEFPHGDGSTWPNDRPEELAAGLDSGSDYDARDEERERPAEDDPFHDEHDEHGRTSLAARALQALVILLIGAAIALWALPRVAPHLPAPIAEAVRAPGMVTEADLTALRAEIEEANATRIAALETRLAEAEGGAAGADLSTLEGRVAELESRIETLGGAASGGDAGLAQQVEDLSAAQSNLRAQLDSLSGSLSNLGDAAGNLPPEAAERLSGFAAATEALRAEMGSVNERVDQLAARLDEAEARFDERASAAESAAQTAQTEAADAQRKAQVNAGFAQLMLALDEGRPYAGPMASLTEFGPAPDPLAAHADAGVPRIADLRESFTPAAHDAMEAQATAEAGDAFASKALAAFRARLQGVPVDKVEGEGLDAQLGAAAAALREGEVAQALEALEGLPPAAGEAMGPWMERARARVAAIDAAETWRGELLGAN